MILCDTHADTLFALATRPERADQFDVSLAKLQQGGVSAQTLALYVGGRPDTALMAQLFDKMYAALEGLKQQGWKQLDDYRDAVEGESAFVLSVEGCDLLEGDLSMISDWRRRGVRMAALTWNHENCVATPASFGPEKGLKPFGREAVKEMQRLGIGVDTSHLNVRGFYDLLEMGIIPLASHSCCTALCDHRRNLTDQQLKDLFQAGGYVGVNFYPHFLKNDGNAALSDVCDHILHMLEMGGDGHIGFGSDFDGIECKPVGLSGPQDLPALLAALKERGLSDAQIRGIAGENLLRYYDRIDPR